MHQLAPTGVIQVASRIGLKLRARRRAPCAVAALLILAVGDGAARAAELPQHVVTLRPSARAESLRCPDDLPLGPYPTHADPGVPAPEADSTLAEIGRGAPQSPFSPGADWPALAPGRPVRIGVWGDSHMAGPAFRNALAAIFESRGLAVQSASMSVNLTQPGIYLPLRIACAPQREWVLRAAYASKEPLDVGLGLSTLISAQPRSRLWLDLRRSDGDRRYANLHIRYTPSTAPVRLVIGADQSLPQTVQLPARRANGPALEELLIRSVTSIATLRIQVLEGSFRLQGLIIDTAGVRADVTLDSYGLPSATARGWSNAYPETLREALTGLPYDMAILAYGTNEAAAPDFNAMAYESELRSALKAFRGVLPSAACVLLGPPDRGVVAGHGAAETPRDRYFYAARHSAVAQIQRRVAPEFACQFWDWQQAMGGMGSSYTMAGMSPALMQKDLTHMTSAGYRWAARELASYLHWLPEENR